jgi:hypothetical protein
MLRHREQQGEKPQHHHKTDDPKHSASLADFAAISKGQ